MQWLDAEHKSCCLERRVVHLIYLIKGSLINIILHLFVYNSLIDAPLDIVGVVG